MTIEQKAFVDRYLWKFISRKLFICCLGIPLEYTGHLSTNMMILMATLITGQSIVDIVQIWKKLT